MKRLEFWARQPIIPVGMLRPSVSPRWPAFWAAVAALVLVASPAWAGTDGSKAAADKKKEASKKDADSEVTIGDEMTITDEGLELGNAMVIEGRVEKPQVQFTLLREAPPLRDIRFEESFLPEILRLKP